MNTSSSYHYIALFFITVEVKNSTFTKKYVMEKKNQMQNNIKFE